MNKNTKRLLWIAGILILALVVVAVVKKRSQGDAKVTSAVSSERTIVETVVANGKIQPETEVIISSEVSGKILELPFNEGAKVLKGELLAKINPDLAQAALDRAEAAYNNALANKANAAARLVQSKAQLRNSELSFRRSEKLFEDGAISQSEFDNAQATFETAEAEVTAAEESVKAARFTVQSAQASVKEAGDSYSRTTIVAPMDGTISRLEVEEGEQVVGAMQMTGTEIMRVANLDVMEVLVDVNESDIVRVAFNDTAAVEVDAYINRKFKGIVTEIANSAKSSGMTADQVTNFEVKIRILQDSYADLVDPEHPELSPFRPGMNATVDIITARKENVVVVPIESVTTRTDTAKAEKVSAVDRLVGQKAEDDGEPFTVVFVLTDEGRAQIQVVETGIQDDKYIEITKGIDLDTEVISGPYDLVSQKLMPGDKVEAVSKEDLYSKD
ncbi:efflux RND transporter periplasmic adaptor subunit [Cryomorphaceae bacterium 1068]|nr:efflux RND transporter periplasmic adaptor subunit [Cryomorphaceae bacterium 1068]